MKIGIIGMILSAFFMISSYYNMVSHAIEVFAAVTFIIGLLATIIVVLDSRSKL